MAKKVRGVKHIKDDVYLIDYQAKLERRQERIHANSLSEARAIRDERKVMLRKQTAMDRNGAERLNATFAEAWEKLDADLKTDRVSESNLYRHDAVFQSLFYKFLPLKAPYVKNLSQLSLPFFLDYKNYFVNDLKRCPNGGWRSQLIIIKSMMRRLQNLGFCEKEIVEELCKMKRPSFEKKSYPDVSREQLSKLFEFIKKDRPDCYYPIYFVCRTGRRINETLSIEKRDLEWEGFNLIRINIRAETTKTKRAAPITTLDADLRQAIRETIRLNAERGTKYLFPNTVGGKSSSDNLLIYLKKVSAQVIGVTLNHHYFRHRLATECQKSGVSFADISGVTGLQDYKVMQRHYSHATDGGQGRVLDVSRV